MLNVEAKPKEELNQLAIDIEAGRVFTDRHLRNADELPMVFMVLALMKPDQMEEIEKTDIGMVYEYLDKAGPCSMNGLPCFFSMHYLTTSDTQYLTERIAKLRGAIASIDDKAVVHD